MSGFVLQTDIYDNSIEITLDWFQLAMKNFLF